MFAKKPKNKRASTKPFKGRNYGWEQMTRELDKIEAHPCSVGVKRKLNELDIVKEMRGKRLKELTYQIQARAKKIDALIHRINIDMLGIFSIEDALKCYGQIVLPEFKKSDEAIEKLNKYLDDYDLGMFLLASQADIVPIELNRDYWRARLTARVNAYRDARVFSYWRAHEKHDEIKSLMLLRNEEFDFMCLNFEKNIIGEQDRETFNQELDGEYIRMPEYDEENIE